MSLADRMRPKNLDEIIGQEHIIGKDKMLRKALENNTLPHLILYGPPGTGKTSFAEAISEYFGRTFYKLNAVSCNTDDIKKVLKETETINGINGITLFIDEIGYMNVRVQQLVLEKLEDSLDKFRLIAATTQNPSFYIHPAILSRTLVLEFKELEEKDIIKGLENAVKFCENEQEIKIDCEREALERIAQIHEGDLRASLNFFEIILAGKINREKREATINIEDVLNLPVVKTIAYDKNEKYNLESALQKSIRGSDPDASIFYLACLVKVGDLKSICRRVSIIACEDVFGQAVTVVQSCIQIAETVGWPEARIPLAHAVLYLATYPKSNCSIKSIDKALYDLDNIDVGDIPNHLKDSHYKDAKRLKRGEGYKYPHDYPNNYVKQQYLPDKIKNKKYYEYGNTKYEQGLKEYWKKIKEK
ncbi:replication-associated recombination protein A [Clostridium sp.]|uniref:replication-associated recombination protein A n=1 Tax=Clostridium sp. TaxID=1506 RepID=UPI001B4DFF42|nr:replication-associated recombination protein A [Clostridium sp.]MBP3916008.1 replication-associated recombination protein A [Clostridium sp.]